jgi:hypothetical protein
MVWVCTTASEWAAKLDTVLVCISRVVWLKRDGRTRNFRLWTLGWRAWLVTNATSPWSWHKSQCSRPFVCWLSYGYIIYRVVLYPLLEFLSTSQNKVAILQVLNIAHLKTVTCYTSICSRNLKCNTIAMFFSTESCRSAPDITNDKSHHRH